jgi:O-antigen ligase
MNLATLNQLRTRLYHSAWFPLLFLLFVAEFYFIPEDKWHSNLFRVGLLLPFLLVFPWRQFAARLAGSPTLVIAGLLITSLLLSLIWSNSTEIDMADKMLLHGLYIAGFVLIGSDILVRHPGHDARLFYWLGWLIVITGALSIWWFYQDHNFPRARLRAIGQLRHPGFAASLYGFVGLYHFMAVPYVTAARAWRRWLPGVLAVAMAALVIVLTQSRGIFLATLLVLLLGALITREKRYLVALACIGLAVAVAAVGWSDELLTMVSRRGWDSHRLAIWQQALAQIAQAPLFGHGLLVDTSISIRGTAIGHPHNILLSTALYGGLVSAGLLLWLMLRVLHQGWRYWLSEQDIKPLLLSTFGIIYLMTDGYRLISNPFPNWIYFWLPVIWTISRDLRGMTATAAVNTRP